MDGAARVTGIPVASSSRYRPNCAALSDVPRATSMINRGFARSSTARSFSIGLRSASRVRSSAAGCSRISSNIFDMV